MPPQVIGVPVSYVAGTVEPDGERAQRLQPLIEALVDRFGVTKVAARTGLSGTAVLAFAKGRVTPRAGSLDAYQEAVKAAEAGFSRDEDTQPPRSAAKETRRSVLVSGG